MLGNNWLDIKQISSFTTKTEHKNTGHKDFEGIMLVANVNSKRQISKIYHLLMTLDMENLQDTVC